MLVLLSKLKSTKTIQILIILFSNRLLSITKYLSPWIIYSSFLLYRLGWLVIDILVDIQPLLQNITKRLRKPKRKTKPQGCIKELDITQSISSQAIAINFWLRLESLSALTRGTYPDILEDKQHAN
jgi:hypothetical protein